MACATSKGQSKLPSFLDGLQLLSLDQSRANTYTALGKHMQQLDKTWIWLETKQGTAAWILVMVGLAHT
jgi:hypothetical protein